MWNSCEIHVKILHEIHVKRVSRELYTLRLCLCKQLNKFTLDLLNSWSLEVQYLSSKDLGPGTHISLFFNPHLSKSGRLHTPAVKRVILG